MYHNKLKEIAFKLTIVLIKCDFTSYDYLMYNGNVGSTTTDFGSAKNKIIEFN